MFYIKSEKVFGSNMGRVVYRLTDYSTFTKCHAEASRLDQSKAGDDGWFHTCECRKETVEKPPID